jgi:hypothetical protein
VATSAKCCFFLAPDSRSPCRPLSPSPSAAMVAGD